MGGEGGAKQESDGSGSKPARDDHMITLHNIHYTTYPTNGKGHKRSWCWFIEECRGILKVKPTVLFCCRFQESDRPRIGCRSSCSKGRISHGCQCRLNRRSTNPSMPRRNINVKKCYVSLPFLVGQRGKSSERNWREETRFLATQRDSGTRASVFGRRQDGFHGDTYVYTVMSFRRRSDPSQPPRKK